MNEQDVRALVREAVERHLGRPEKGAGPLFSEKRGPAPFSSPAHPSHILLKVVAGSESGDGACVIEPSVRCNHCGFCQSFGH